MIERPGQPGSKEKLSSQERVQKLESRALAEGKQFLVLFLYLWVLFGLFVLNERIVLRQHEIDFAAHGFAILNALVLAKVMLIAEHFNMSRWLDRRPLIYSIFFDAFLFGILFILFHVTEQALVAKIGGKGDPSSIHLMGGGGIGGVVCVAVILFFTLIPYFAFTKLGRTLGWDRMKTLLFGTRDAMAD